jgi:hypothetical protein
MLLAAFPCDIGTASLSDEQVTALCQLRVETAPAKTELLLALYKRPGFERARATQADDYLKRLRAWLMALFETTGAERYSNVTRTGVLVLAAAAALVTLARFWSRRRPRQGDDTRSAPSFEKPPESPYRSLDDARALVSQRPREAARLGLLAVLASLEYARLMRTDRTKTNREVADELVQKGASRETADAVRQLFEWFDRAWYSLTELDGASVERFLDEAQALITSLIGRPT